MDDILVYGGDKLIKKTNGKEFREYRVIKCDNGIIVKLVGISFVKLLSFCHPYCTDVWIHKLFLPLIIILTFSIPLDTTIYAVRTMTMLTAY